MNDDVRRPRRWPLAGPDVRAAALVALAGLALTVLGVLAATRLVRAESGARLEAHAQRLDDEITSRLMHAEHGLRAAAAAFATSARLDRRAFRAYVQARDFSREFPGIRGLGFIERVAQGGLPAFVDRERQDGAPAFEVRTQPGAPDLYVIKYIEPLVRNGPAMGLDIGADAVRREAAERAVHTGETALTGPVRLVQDPTGGAGWLMLVPAFTGPNGTPQERAQSLLGLFYSPIIIAELLGNLKAFVEYEVDFQLFDGAALDGALLFDSRPPDARRTALVAPEGSARHVSEHAMVVGGRALTLRVASAPDLVAGVHGAVPLAVGAAGLLVSALLAWATWLLVGGRARALAMAQSMTSDLRRMAQVVDHTSNAVVGLDLQLRVQWVNEGFTRTTGWHAEQCIGQPIAELLQHPQGDPGARAILQGALARGHSARVELLNRRKDGSPVWMDIEIQPTVDDAGRHSGWIVIALDITHRKHVEAMLQAREHLMRVVTDNIPARVTYWDASLRCRFANQTFCRWFGRTREQMEGLPMSAELFGRDVWPRMQPAVQRVLRGEPQQFQQQDRSTVGTSAVWQVHYLPDIDASGQVQGIFVLALDVTELRQARDAALQASQAKSHFLSSMSHELRTPMNAILGMLALLQRTPLDAQQADYAAKAHDAGRSLLDLLDDVLDLSKIEAGKMALHPRPFGFDGLLRELSTMLSVQVGPKPVEVLYDLDPMLPAQLLGDDVRLRQILINLCGNAIKFTERGEVLVAVRLLREEGGRATVRLSVQDSGIGMSQDELACLFTEFTQANAGTARRFGGTGLGLSIVQRLAGMMGSRVQVESRPGEGSCFWLELVLPVAEPAVAGPAGGGRVLVIDDNPTARLVLASQLRQLGHAVDVAHSGEEGLAMWSAAARPYAAVLVDWSMPGLDGWETVRRLRALPGAEASTLVVMVTAAGREMLHARQDRERALLDGFVTKPVTASMLREALHGRQFAVPPPVPAGAAQPAPLAGVRLLVAEDNAINQQIALELLRGEGADVTLAGDGRQAVAALQVRPDGYDLVFMDLQMPVMDGYAATRAIRALPGLAQLPIVAMTANAMDSDRQACLAAGMSDHVGKPFQLADLVRVVRQHLGREPLPGDRPAPPAPAAAPAPAAWDRALALRYLDGDADLLERVAGMFRASLCDTLHRLPALLREERDEALRLLHTLKGQAATVGALPLAEAARAAEASLLAGAYDDEVLGRVHALGTAIAQALAALPVPLDDVPAPVAGGA